MGRNVSVRRIDGLMGTGVLTFGLLLVVVGVVTDSLAVAALGVVLLLTGLYARSRQV